MNCCSESACRRTKPLLVRRGGLSGRWYLVTDYKVNGSVLEMQKRHDVTDEIGNAVIAEVLQVALAEGAPRAVLDRVASKFGLRVRKESTATPASAES